jgi:putative redox protein
MTPAPQKVEFAGSNGAALAARLDLPAGAPRAFALFAHCFTCSKDTVAAARIAGALAERGFGVLRFDFTGLGQSGGDFASTSFSSNVFDLVTAADWLREHHQAPQLLVGHSLGGAAVLAAAERVPEARAVATIGAPADAGHVRKHFAAKFEEIERDGKAVVTLAGRRFTITRDFLDDLAGHKLTDRIARLRRALIVFHSPRDEIVGIDNASAIFVAAKHPKSFVSLDDADHLLTRRADAVYVAEVLASWAGRYLGPAEVAAEEEAPPEGAARVEETGAGRFQQRVQVGPHRLMADEPAEAGGLDSGPSPYDFLSVALGACTSMTLRLYAEHKKLKVGRIRVDVSHGKVHAEDCKDCREGREGRIDRFERVIHVEGEVAPEVAARLVEIAGKCPVHRTLEASSAVVTRLAGP